MRYKPQIFNHVIDLVRSVKIIPLNVPINSLKRALTVLPRADKVKILIVGIAQTAAGLLDLLALGLVAFMGSLTIRGVQSSQPGERTAVLLKFLGVADSGIQVQIGVLGISTALLFLLRTFLSIYLTRKILFYLSGRSAEISKDLISRMLDGSLVDVQHYSRQENIYILTTGVNLITIGLVGSTINLVVDGFLLLFLITGLFIVDSTVAFFSVLLFAVTAFVLLKALHMKASRIGATEAKMDIRSNELISEVLESFREVTVRNTKKEYVEEIGRLRLSMGHAHAELTFMPNIGKYVIEAVIILGTLSLAALEFLTKNSSGAVASLAVFLAAGSRVAPALLRIQQNLLAIRSSSSGGATTMRLLERYQEEILEPGSPFQHTFENIENFSPTIQIKGLYYKYPGALINAVNNINLSILPGEMVAIVGPSGAGKSTLVDLILGALKPDSGEINISGVKAILAIERWPGKIAYVPQQVFISPGTIKENLLLGLPTSNFSEEDFWQVLKSVELQEMVVNLPNQLDSHVGDAGSKMSGGQRQRLGIARALLTAPQIMVLDEATSSLDAETEAAISKNIQSIRGHSTLLVVAHRLSTVRNADRVIYLEGGTIRSTGTFDEVRKEVLSFDTQAKLMGL